MAEPRSRDGSVVVFTWGPDVSRPHQVRQVTPAGVTHVRNHPSEEAMLQAWLLWFRDADPDILNVFQVTSISIYPPLAFPCLILTCYNHCMSAFI